MAFLFLSNSYNYLCRICIMQRHQFYRTQKTWQFINRPVLKACYVSYQNMRSFFFWVCVCVDATLAEGRSACNRSSNAGICLTNCVGYHKLLFHEQHTVWKTPHVIPGFGNYLLCAHTCSSRNIKEHQKLVLNFLRQVLITNEMHNSYNQFLFTVFCLLYLFRTTRLVRNMYSRHKTVE